MTTPNIKDLMGDLQEGNISITSDFQRGDEETGVWNETMKIAFIDSLMKGYGIGLITLVRDHGEHSWKVLDGGNRLRAIRDFIIGKFKWENQKYSQLVEVGKIDYMTLPCQRLTIESSDPPDTIAEMFTRLNTSSKNLSAGELCKAHGYRGNILEIEVAKKIVGDKWTNSRVTEPRIDAIRERWTSIIGEITESSRCESLKTIIGYIMSAITEKLKIFSPQDAYKKWKKYFTTIGDDNANEKIDKIVEKFNSFLDNVESMSEGAKEFIFKKKKNGMPRTIIISPIWYVAMSDDLLISGEEIVDFYEKVVRESKIRYKFEKIMQNGDNYPTVTKMNEVIGLIQDSDSESESDSE